MAKQLELTIPLEGDQAVKCPRCQSDSGLHFDQVSLIDPGADVVPLHGAGDQGLSVVTAAIGDSTRADGRYLVVLPHWCSSCGESGEIVLRQNGGQTVSQYRQLDDVPMNDD